MLSGCMFDRVVVVTVSLGAVASSAQDVSTTKTSSTNDAALREYWNDFIDAKL